MSFPKPENNLTPEESSSGATATGEASAGGNDLEESVEQYMAALLERVRVPTTAGQGSPPKRSQQSASNPQVQPSTPVRNQTAKTRQVEATFPADEESERKPARVPVEKRPQENMDNVSAMRRLATLSAHLAVETHSVKQLVTDARRTLGFAAATMLASFLLLRSPIAARPPGCIAALFSTLVAAACCWQYFRITREMARRLLAIRDEQPTEG